MGARTLTCRSNIADETNSIYESPENFARREEIFLHFDFYRLQLRIADDHVFLSIANLKYPTQLDGHVRR
jgi:hypothetical protein